MKKLNKKGFTIVELVIVMAVIAILAAVMIPTFSGVINQANESAALQNIRATYNEVLAYDLEGDGVWTDDYVIEYNGYYATVDGGQLNVELVKGAVPSGYTELSDDLGDWADGVYVKD